MKKRHFFTRLLFNKQIYNHGLNYIHIMVLGDNIQAG